MRRIIAIGFGLGLGCAACIPPLQTRVPDAAPTPARLILLPPVVAAFELDAFGKATEQLDRAREIEAVVAPEIRQLVASIGGAIATEDKLRACGRDDDCAALFVRFVRWGSAASFEIAVQKAQVRNLGRRSVGEWRFRPELSGLRSAFDSEFALTLVVRDLYETGGRALLGAFGGVYTFFKRVAVACVSDLRDGRMIVCASLADRWGDLREPHNAKQATHDLLAEIFGLPPAHFPDPNPGSKAADY